MSYYKMASAEVSNKVKEDSNSVDHWKLRVQVDDALSKPWVHEWCTASKDTYDTVRTMFSPAANTNHMKSVTKFRNLFWTTVFWHEIIQVTVTVINVQIIISQYFHFYNVISRWVPEMLVQILTASVCKFSSIIHPTFIKSAHLMGGKGKQMLQWVQLVMKLKEYSPWAIRHWSPQTLGKQHHFWKITTRKSLA